jgi:hypothetical protein
MKCAISLKVWSSSISLWSVTPVLCQIYLWVFNCVWKFITNFTWCGRWVTASWKPLPDTRDAGAASISAGGSSDMECAECRICLAREPIEKLIAPCRCKGIRVIKHKFVSYFIAALYITHFRGTLLYVHKSCLENWLNMKTKQSDTCGVCRFQYTTKRVPKVLYILFI